MSHPLLRNMNFQARSAEMFFRVYILVVRARRTWSQFSFRLAFRTTGIDVGREVSP